MPKTHHRLEHKPTLTLKTVSDRVTTFLFSRFTDVNEANPPPFQAELLEIIEFSMVMVESGAANIPPSYISTEKVKTELLQMGVGVQCKLIYISISSNGFLKIQQL